MVTMQRDVVLWTSSKLTGSWSAEAIVDDLDVDLIHQLCRVFADLEPLVRVRLLISCCLLSPARREELQGPIHELLQTASTDENEWVRFYGNAISSGDGDVNLQRALGAFPEVIAYFCPALCAPPVLTSLAANSKRMLGRKTSSRSH